MPRAYLIWVIQLLLRPHLRTHAPIGVLLIPIMVRRVIILQVVPNLNHLAIAPIGLLLDPILVPLPALPKAISLAIRFPVLLEIGKQPEVVYVSPSVPC